MNNAPRAAVIVEKPAESNGYRYVVRCDDDGDVLYLSGLGQPQGAALGDRGTVEYRATRSCGYWCWARL